MPGGESGRRRSRGIPLLGDTRPDPLWSSASPTCASQCVLLMFSRLKGMLAMDVEAEIRDLKRRVGEPEGSFGFLTQQVQGVHRDLLGFQQQTNRRFDKVDSRFDKVEADIRGVKADVASLRQDLPSVVGEVMREVLRGQKR